MSVVSANVFAAIDLQRVTGIDPDLRELVPYEIACRHRCLPLYVLDNETLVVAVEDPTNDIAFDDIHWWTGWTSQPVVAERDTLTRSIAAFYGAN